MAYWAVRCTKCREPILLDEGRTIVVGGGAMPYTTQCNSSEREIMCPDCRVVIRFCDGDVVTVEPNEPKEPD